MATILSIICQKTKQHELIPIAIVVGFALDFVIVYNYLKQ
jgi:hypothetical protein